MSRLGIALPHLVLSDDALVADPSGWTVVAEGKELRRLKDGDAFPEWDPKLVYKLERDFTVAAAIAESLAVDPQLDSCALTCIGSSGNGAVRLMLGQVPLPMALGGVARMVISPPGDSLAKELTLTVVAHLSHRRSPASGVSPRVPGDRLWESRDHIRLEGGSARLPLYEADLSQAFPGQGLDGAAFHVLIGDDPHETFESSVMVYVNTRRMAFMRGLAAGLVDPEAQLWETVIRRVTFAAAMGEWIDPVSDYAPGSIGHAVSRWASQAFDGMTPREIAEAIRDDYPSVEARLESWCYSQRHASLGGSDV